MGFPARLAFGVGAIGIGIFSAVPSVILLFYLTEQLGLPLEYAGPAAAAPKFWALISDPLIGKWSDRARTRIGRRRPFLIAGSVIFAMAFVALFSLPTLSNALTLFVLATSAYLLTATAYSLYAVPYIALPAELGRDPAARTRLMAHRMGWGLTGVLIGSAGAPMLVAAFGGGASGYSSMAVILACLSFAVMIIPAICIREPAPRERDGPLNSLSVLADPAFVALAFVYLLTLTAIGTMTAAAPYFVVSDMGRSEGDVGTVFLVILLLAVIATPVWGWIATRIGKLPVMTISFIIFALSLALVAAVQPGWETFLIICIPLGVGFGGLQLIPFALLAEIIAARSKTGSDLGGVYTGAWTAIEKLGLGIGPLAAAFLLKVTAYETLGAARVTFAAAPAAFAILTLIMLAVVHRPISRSQMV